MSPHYLINVLQKCICTGETPSSTVHTGAEYETAVYSILYEAGELQVVYMNTHTDVGVRAAAFAHLLWMAAR